MPLTTLPENPTRLQRLQAEASALVWLWTTPQPGGLTHEQYLERIGPVHAAIEEELRRMREGVKPPRRAREMPEPVMPAWAMEAA